METRTNTYDFVWFSVALPLSILASIGLTLWFFSPFAIPLCLFFSIFWFTRKWASLIKRLLASLGGTLALLWLIPAPSQLYGHYWLATNSVSDIKASERVKPVGNILKISNNHSINRSECDYQCARFLILPSVDTLTLVFENQTPLTHFQHSRYLPSPTSITLAMGSGAECSEGEFTFDDELSSYRQFADVLENRCLVTRPTPNKYDLILRSGRLSVEGWPMLMGMPNYHETKNANGKIISRSSDLTVCPLGAPFALVRKRRGFTFWRECIRTGLSSRYNPIDGLDFST